MIRAALLRLRAAPKRAVLAALGVLLASAMAGAAITVGYALHTGFDRAAREADLPDVIVRFRPERRPEVDAIVRRLPNLAARSYRTQVNRRHIAGGSGSSDNGAIELVEGRRGYAIVDGRDVDGRDGEVVIDRGVANEWGVHVGDRITRAFSAACASRASRWRPTTSRSRCPRCRTSTSRTPGSRAWRACARTSTSSSTRR